jgi:hypothetical protein
MRIVSSFTFASALALVFAASALADLSDPTSDSSIPLRGTEPLVDTQQFSTPPKPEDTYKPPKTESLPPATVGGAPSAPFANSQKEVKAAKQHTDSGSGGILGAPDQAMKKSVGLSDRAAKGSLDLTDQAAKSSLEMSDKAAKSSIGLADRAAKTTLGVPGKLLKSLF